MSRTARTLGLLACLLLVGGCGGSDDGGSGGGDAAGVKETTIASGESATVTGPNGKLDVKVGVDATEGSIDDLKDFNLEDAERTMTPWYVSRTVRNDGKEITSDDAFTGLVDVFDDTGAEPKKLALLGDFPACKLVNAPETFPSGDEFTSCNVYLVEEGRTLEKAVVTDTHFEGDNDAFVWKFD